MFRTFATSSCRLAPIAALALMAPAAQAQDNRIAFELGGGLAFSPAYQGSDEYRAKPAFQGALTALSFGGISAGGGDGLGFGVAPSFGLVGKRDASEFSELKGFDDVGWAVEMGVKLRYRWENAEVSAAVRKGFGGHHGVVGELAADAILRPDDRTTLRVGPRVSFANDAFADTYFSVPSSATNLAAYSADGGLESYGLSGSLRHELTDTWSIEGKLGWNRLTGDFADSPVTRAGSEDQFSASVTLIRQFDWRF